MKVYDGILFSNPFKSNLCHPIIYINILNPENYVIANNLKISAFHVRVILSLYYDFLGK